MSLDPSIPRLALSFSLDTETCRMRLDPRDPGFFSDPYPTYAELHRSAPAVWWEEAGGLALAGHAEISAILRDRRFGRILPAGPDGRADHSSQPEHVKRFYEVEKHSLLDMEPPTHTRLRGLVSRAFVSRRIDHLEVRIRHLANALIDRFSSAGHVDLVQAFATPLPVTVIAELLGIDASAGQDMVDWSHRMVAMYRLGRSESCERDADAAAAAFADFMRLQIGEKRRRPGDDLISHLIAAETGEGRLDEDEMVGTLILLMNAGHEATVHQIGNGVKTILECGEDLGALVSTRERASLAVEEALRFDTPLHLFTRIALEDVRVSDRFTLRRGESVALLLGAGNRDPLVYTEPQRFNALRREQPHVSFGAGIHFCLGAPLARLELRVALETLIARLPDMKIAGEPRYRDSFHFRGLERLDIVFQPRD